MMGVLNGEEVQGDDEEEDGNTEKDGKEDATDIGSDQSVDEQNEIEQIDLDDDEEIEEDKSPTKRKRKNYQKGSPKKTKLSEPDDENDRDENGPALMHWKRDSSL